MILSDAANQHLFLLVVPESLGVLLFGLSLIFLTIGLRWFMKHYEEGAQNEIKHITEQH